MSENVPKPGPNPDRLKIDGDWEKSVKEALDKPKPEAGWPEGPKPKKKAKKKAKKKVKKKAQRKQPKKG